MVLNKFKVICKECGFETIMSDNERSITLRGLFLDGKEYHWTRCTTKEEYENKLKILEKESKTDKDAEHEFKKEKHLQKNRKENNIETFKCPKCGKETLEWELLESSEV